MPQQTIAKSSRWVLAGTVLSKPVQLVTIILLARMLGPEGFGIVALTTSTAITLYGVVNLGLTEASNKFVAEFYSGDPSKAVRYSSTIATIGLSASIVCFVALWFVK